MNFLCSLRNVGIREWRSVACAMRNTAHIRMSSDAPESEQTEESAEPPVDPTKDRRVPIPIETGLRYMDSNAYKLAYGSQPVWVQYRRNHKGQLPPKKTRQNCVRKQMISTGNPCPICRDEYLVLHEKNVNLLKQFISEHTGQVLSYSTTGLCQRKHRDLQVAINRAKDQGTITYDVPFREYDYSEYMPKGAATDTNNQ